MLRAALLSVGLLAACAPPPEVAAHAPRAGDGVPYPVLVPLGPLVARLPASTARPQGLEARAALLRARAARLRAARL